MKIESKTDEECIVVILAAFKKAKIDQTLAEALSVLRACDLLQKSLDSFRRPPVPPQPDDPSKKVLPMKLPRGKK